MTFRIIATDLPVPISVPIFAAVDCCDGLCWVDDAFHATQFDTMADAEDFARTRIGPDGWKVQSA